MFHFIPNSKHRNVRAELTYPLALWTTSASPAQCNHKVGSDEQPECPGFFSNSTQRYHAGAEKPAALHQIHHLTEDTARSC